MRRLICALLLTLAGVGPAWAQATGRAANMPVKTDANGYLTATAYQITAPVNAAGLFANTFIKTDANGYLIVAIAGGASLEFSQMCLGSGSQADACLVRDAAGYIGQRNSTTEQQFAVYNTFTSATNYERLVVGWGELAGSRAYIGTKAGGGGGTKRRLDIDGSTVYLMHNGAAKAHVEADGFVVDSAAARLTGTAFTSLPTGVAGMFAYVTDSSTATWGATIAGGGANPVLAFYNGTNWTVAGK